MALLYCSVCFLTCCWEWTVVSSIVRSAMRTALETIPQNCGPCPVSSRTRMPYHTTWSCVKICDAYVALVFQVELAGVSFEDLLVFSTIDLLPVSLLVEALVSPWRQIPAVLPVKTVVTDADVSSTNNVLDTRCISRRSYRCHSLSVFSS